MIKTLVKKTQYLEIRLMGITCRTNNKSALESGLPNNQIIETLQKYFGGAWPQKIPNRIHPGKTYCVYTDYESDFRGDYTYFVGEEVSSFDTENSDLQTLLIPPASYLKFTNNPGAMPNVCVSMWKKIWAMAPFDLGGERAYVADFEVYDERSRDLHNAVLDICIGIRLQKNDASDKGVLL